MIGAIQYPLLPLLPYSQRVVDCATADALGRPGTTSRDLGHYP